MVVCIPVYYINYYALESTPSRRVTFNDENGVAHVDGIGDRAQDTDTIVGTGGPFTQLPPVLEMHPVHSS